MNEVHENRQVKEQRNHSLSISKFIIFISKRICLFTFYLIFVTEIQQSKSIIRCLVSLSEWNANAESRSILFNSRLEVVKEIRITFFGTKSHSLCKIESYVCKFLQGTFYDMIQNGGAIISLEILFSSRVSEYGKPRKLYTGPKA